jgi:preprotein translocase subunit SecA
MEFICSFPYDVHASIRWAFHAFGTEQEACKMSNLFERMINADSRKMHAVEKEVAKVEKLAAKCEAMSNVQLAAETPKLKKRLQDGETLDDVLPEAFAIAREACRRVRI